MGTSNSKISTCPFDQLRQSKCERAKSMPYTRGEASEFYFLCVNDKQNEVRQILNAEDSPSIDLLNQLQRNGSTALHAATYYNHLEIVQLLLERNCPRLEINRFGNTAYDEAKTNEMKQLYHRYDPINRFHDINPVITMSLYLPEENIEGTNLDKTDEYVHLFKTESEVLEYSLNQQTTAMWVKFSSWFMHTFRTFIERDNVHVDALDLINHPDFKQFLKGSLSEQNLQKTMKSVDEAKQRDSIEPLITLYTSEDAGFYGPFNQLLAQSSSETKITPHLCDRYIIEFHIRRHELKQRAFTGITYRGGTIPASYLSVYQLAMSNKPPGVIGLKAFTSTSRDPLVALNFAFRVSPSENEKHVLFIFEITETSPTIIGIDDISNYGHEQEVLILPGNLFTVTKIQEQKNPAITKVYLKHWKTSISFIKKIRQTIRAGRQSVLDYNEQDK